MSLISFQVNRIEVSIAIFKSVKFDSKIFWNDGSHVDFRLRFLNCELIELFKNSEPPPLCTMWDLTPSLESPSTK